MTRLKDCLLAACLVSPLTQAADLGTWGDLWPVREQDMLQLITQRPVAAIFWPVGPDDGCV